MNVIDPPALVTVADLEDARREKARLEAALRVIGDGAAAPAALAREVLAGESIGRTILCAEARS